jgi:hypothetical protein
VLGYESWSDCVDGVNADHVGCTKRAVAFLWGKPFSMQEAGRDKYASDAPSLAERLGGENDGLLVLDVNRDLLHPKPGLNPARQRNNVYVGTAKLLDERPTDPAARPNNDRPFCSSCHQVPGPSAPASSSTVRT